MQIRVKAVSMTDTELSTQRLILRRWNENDAADLYQAVCNPKIGPMCGWQPHRSVAESKAVIQTVFSAPEQYALCLKSDRRAIGAVSLKLKGESRLTGRDDESELGFWLAEPFWGQGLMSEAARALLHHAFVDLGMRQVWCAYYDGNTNSQRVQEKLGFKYLRTDEAVDVPLLGEQRTSHISVLAKSDFVAQ